MKKRIILILLITGIGIGLFSCDITVNENGDSQTMYVRAQADTVYYDEEADEEVHTEVAQISGSILDTPIPEFIYLRTSNKTYSDSTYSSYAPGEVTFGVQKPIRVTSETESIDIEIETSEGSMQGEISRPEPISNYEVNNGKLNLQLDSALTIAWEESDADFYEAFVVYAYELSSGRMENKMLRTYTTDTSATFSEDNFSQEGMIQGVSITPINGPYPEEGAEGNMSGEGRGFFYYTSMVTRARGRINVVASLNKKTAKSSNNNFSYEKPNNTEIIDRIKNEIEGTE